MGWSAAPSAWHRRARRWHAAAIGTSDGIDGEDGVVAGWSAHAKMFMSFVISTTYPPRTRIHEFTAQQQKPHNRTYLSSSINASELPKNYDMSTF